MAEPIPFRRPIHKGRLRTDEAERIIRERARKTENVFFADHAWVRVADRSITSEDAFEILLNGHVDGQPVMTENGEWKCTVTRRMAGTRSAGAVTVILRGAELFVKTVMWMD